MSEPDAYTTAQGSINNDYQALVMRLAQLRAQQAQANQQYTQNFSGAYAAGDAGYKQGVSDLQGDIAAQGFGGIATQPIANQIAQQQGTLNAQQARQQNYASALAQQQNSIIDRAAWDAGPTAGVARDNLALNYGVSMLDDGSGGGGGGGGYGGYGHGGYGGSDYLTAGDAGLEADLAAEPYNDTPVTSDAQQQVGNRPLDTLLGDYLYGTHGKGDQFLKGGFGHVNTFGNNAASLASKYARYAKAKFSKTWTDQQGNHHKAIDKKTLKAFAKNLQAEQKKVQKNHAADHKVKVDQKKKHVKAKLRGLE